MKPVAIWIFAIFMLSCSVNVQAQTNIKWYWGYHEANQQVIAYNVSGDVNILLEGVLPSSLYRLDDQTATVLIERDSEFSAYILTWENAYLVDTLYTAQYPDDYGRVPPPYLEALPMMYPYILLWNHEISLPLLFNRDMQSVETLEIETWDTVIISEGGRYLRYLVHEETEGRKIRWQLIEYDIIESTTRVVFTRDEEAPRGSQYFYENCQPDTFGEKWFCTKYLDIYPEGGGLPLNELTIIHIDGSIEPIDNDQYLKVDLDGNWHFMSSEFYGNGCDVTCIFEVTDYATGETQVYDLSEVDIPDGVSFNLIYSEVLDSNHILLYDTQQQGSGVVLYLFTNNTVTYLGVIPCCHITSRSADRRWIILYDVRVEGELPITLYNLPSGRVAIREDEIIDLFGFTSGGVYIHTDIFYAYENDLAFTVGADEWLYPGLVIDVLPTGEAIGTFLDIYESIPLGIYITSVENGRELLIPDVRPIFYSNWELQ